MIFNNTNKTTYLLKQLFSLQAHVGHLHFEWNHIMNYYIIGSFQNFNIINVSLTLIILKKALQFSKQIYDNDSYILFISNATGTDDLLNTFLQNMSEKYKLNTYTTNWSPGLLVTGEQFF
ncbi:MAG: 30S ribosomal protein S2 [Nitrososphaeraceae archaeon]